MTDTQLTYMRHTLTLLAPRPWTFRYNEAPDHHVITASMDQQPIIARLNMTQLTTVNGLLCGCGSRHPLNQAAFLAAAPDWVEQLLDEVDTLKRIIHDLAAGELNHEHLRQVWNALDLDTRLQMIMDSCIHCGTILEREDTLVHPCSTCGKNSR